MAKSLMMKCDRYASLLPGWMMLSAGLTLLAATALVPAWRQCRVLSHQRDALKAQEQVLDEQAKSYEQFVGALQDRDPVVIERVALQMLRLKPAGSDLIDMNVLSVAGSQTGVSTDAFASVETWLQKTLPTTEFDVMRAEQSSRLVRLTTGSAKFVLLAVAAILIWAGVQPVRQRPTESPPTLSR